MPYITKEEVKEIRNNLKKALPEFKLSVTMRHHSVVCVSLMKGPAIEGINKEYESINQFWYEKTFKDHPKTVELFKTIMNTINDSKSQKEVTYDGDYGSVPNFYIDINVGKWDKPYQTV